MSRRTALSLHLPVILFMILSANAQVPRFYVDVTVTNGNLGEDVAHSVAMEFLDVIDFEGLSQITIPVKGFVDPERLKLFLPPLLKGPRAYTEILEEPKTTKDLNECWAFVHYFRESEDQGEWDDIQIYIRDGGKYTNSNHKTMMGLRHKKDTDTTTIKGLEASIYRNPNNELDEDYDEVRTVVAVPAKSIDWKKVVAAAKEGIRKGLRLWNCRAVIRDGTINGSVLVIPPGSLEGPSFEKIIVDEIMALEIPVTIAAAFASPIWSGWQHWSQTFSATYDNAFPAFASYSGAVAPPTPALPLPLASAHASREKLTAEVLGSRITARLGKWEEDPQAREAVADFARWFDEGLTTALLDARIEKLMGQGPVPAFAPPLVPVGPVVNGTIVPSPVLFKDLEF
jgi:hypothetical protein